MGLRFFSDSVRAYFGSSPASPTSQPDNQPNPALPAQAAHLADTVPVRGYAAEVAPTLRFAVMGQT